MSTPSASCQLPMLIREQLWFRCRLIRHHSVSHINMVVQRLWFFSQSRSLTLPSLIRISQHLKSAFSQNASSLLCLRPHSSLRPPRSRPSGGKQSRRGEYFPQPCTSMHFTRTACSWKNCPGSGKLISAPSLIKVEWSRTPFRRFDGQSTGWGPREFHFLTVVCPF